METQQLITNALHRLKLNLRANVSFAHLYTFINLFIML